MGLEVRGDAQLVARVLAGSLSGELPSAQLGQDEGWEAKGVSRLDGSVAQPCLHSAQCGPQLLVVASSPPSHPPLPPIQPPGRGSLQELHLTHSRPAPA